MESCNDKNFLTSSRAFINWSGGKDAALALYQVLQNKGISVERLLTTIGKNTKRVAMHAVREELVIAQAEAIGLPLDILYLSENPDMATYEQMMVNRLNNYSEEGISISVFGDINLQDLRQYREDQLAKVKMIGLFPLWNKQTRKLAQEFVESGFKAIVVSVNASLMDDSFVGIPFDQVFLDRLPPTVDPCGENGEFHTFVYDGPIFNEPVQIRNGKKIFWEYPTDPSKPGSTYALWQIDLER